MKHKNLWLLVGLPGSGKSTWAKTVNQDIWNIPNSQIISRDAVRFSMVDENEDYFSKENEVFNTFIREINRAIDYCDNIFVDATHLNPKSRHKVLSRLVLNECTVIAVNFQTSLATCLARNAQRTGRARVPDDVIRDMCKSLSLASPSEKYIDEVIDIVEGE